MMMFQVMMARSNFVPALFGVLCAILCNHLRICMVPSIKFYGGAVVGSIKLGMSMNFIRSFGNILLRFGGEKNLFCMKIIKLKFVWDLNLKSMSLIKTTS